MPDTDAPIPLCSAASFTEGPYADLVQGYSSTALSDLLVEATRLCESETDRRLAPFTITETARAEGMDPDEYTDSANLPMDLQGTLGRSYAYALGASTLVRHAWLREFAPRYQDLWSASVYTISNLTVIRSYGGSQNLTTAQYVGPAPDSGHVWFNLGQFIPIGSYLQFTYSGGYQTVPADLVRACRFMAAWLAASDLNPQTDHDPEQLHTAALMILSNYERT